jgi:hypothetical protein
VLPLPFPLTAGNLPGRNLAGHVLPHRRPWPGPDCFRCFISRGLFVKHRD